MTCRAGSVKRSNTPPGYASSHNRSLLFERGEYVGEGGELCLSPRAASPQAMALTTRKPAMGSKWVPLRVATPSP